MTDAVVDRPDVIIIGAGIAGASLAYFLAKGGARALVIDRAAAAAEASGANAGMVGPSGGQPGTTMELAKLTASLYDEAAAELGETIGWQRQGRLMLAQNAQEARDQEAFIAARRDQQIELHLLRGTEIQQIEPQLADGVVSAVYAPDDGMVDPFRATVAYLRAACRRGAAFLPRAEVTQLLTDGRQGVGVEVAGRHVRAEQVVIAAGAWSAPLAASAGFHLPVVAGRGQMLVTAPTSLAFPRVLRATLVGIRQMSEGNLVIGSDVELGVTTKRVTPERLSRFSRYIRQIVPALGDVPLIRTWSGLRPMSPDGLPILGAVPGTPGLQLLSGFGRSGMTHAPAAARTLADQLLHGQSLLSLDPYSIRRFDDCSV